MAFFIAPPLPSQITICTWGRKHRVSLSFPKKSLRNPESSHFPPTLGWIFNFNQCQAGHAQGWGSAVSKAGSFSAGRVKNLTALTPSAGMGVLSLPWERGKVAALLPGLQTPQLATCALRKEDWDQKGIAGNEKIISTTPSYSYGVAGSFYNYNSWFFLSHARCFISIKLLAWFLCLLCHISPLYWLFRSNLQVKNWSPG